MFESLRMCQNVPPPQAPRCGLTSHQDLWHQNSPHFCTVQQPSVVLTSTCPVSLQLGVCDSVQLFNGLQVTFMVSALHPHNWQLLSQVSLCWLREKKWFRHSSGFANAYICIVCASHQFLLLLASRQVQHNLEFKQKKMCIKVRV